MRIEQLEGLAPVMLLLVKVTAVFLAGFAITTLMQRASATARHLVWLASLLAVLVIPALAAYSPVRFAVLPAAWGGRAAVVSAGGPIAPLSATEAARVPASPRMLDAGATTARVTAPQDPAPRFRLSVAQVALLVWATVALVLLGWLLHGQWSVRRILARATDVSDDAWQGSAMEIADRLGLETLPRLVHADVTMPFACGLRTPVIVLPTDSIDWTPDRRTAVLLHELAHVRRHDIVAHTLGRVVSALYWFHPLAWMAARQLRSESERACDDLALACGTRPSDYAEHLLEIVTSARNHATPSVAMAMATRSEFEGRMLAILDPTLSRTAPTRVQASTLAGGVMMFAIITGALVPKVQSPQPGVRPMAAMTASLPDSVRDRLVDSLRRAGDSTRVTALLTSPTVVGLDAATAATPEHRAPDQRRGDAGADAITPVGAVTASDSSARVTSLVRVLRSDTAASLRRIAAWALHEFDEDEGSIEALVNAVRNDANPKVREMAAWSLASSSDRPRVASALAGVLRTERDQAVRETAAWSLAEGADGDSPATIDALAIAAGDADAEVRETAIWGLGSASPRRAPAVVIRALGDDDTLVRTIAAWALYQIEDASAVSALQAAVARERDDDAKVAMVRALAVMGDPAVGALQRIIEGSNAELRAIAIRALAGRGADPWPQPRPRPRPFP